MHTTHVLAHMYTAMTYMPTTYGAMAYVVMVYIALANLCTAHAWPGHLPLPVGPTAALLFLEVGDEEDVCQLCDLKADHDGIGHSCMTV